MTIKEFVEKAIKGGWRPNFNENMGVLRKRGDKHLTVVKGAPTLSYADMFLDPLAWQAVGKVQGWNGIRYFWDATVEIEEWLYYWHTMIDALAEGKNIVVFLETL